MQGTKDSTQTNLFPQNLLTYTNNVSSFIFFPFRFAEEILNTNNAIWLSHVGHMMLYGSFNDSLVQEQHFAWYGTTSSNGRSPSATSSGAGSHPNANLYPEIRSLR